MIVRGASPATALIAARVHEQPRAPRSGALLYLIVCGSIIAFTAYGWLLRTVALDRRLLARVSALSSARLQEQTPGRDYSLRFMLEMAVWRYVSHRGQIARLRKAFVSV